MSREEAIYELERMKTWSKDLSDNEIEAIAIALKALSSSEKPCTDAISREAVIDIIEDVCPIYGNDYRYILRERVNDLPPVNPTEKVGQCKQCKWWKDSDGAYRRGIGAESKCPMNTQKVYEGDGYCYLYEPKMQDVEE